jgi:hypothetical protein
MLSATGTRNLETRVEGVLIRLVLRISASTDERIRQYASRHGMKHGPMVRQWVEERLAQEEAKSR